MTRKVKLLVALVASAMVVPSLSGHDKEPSKVGKLMRKKLESAQKILEGVALEDNRKTIKHADELMDVSKSVEWHVYKTPQYKMRSYEFRRALDGLIERSQGKEPG